MKFLKMFILLIFVSSINLKSQCYRTVWTGMGETVSLKYEYFFVDRDTMEYTPLQNRYFKELSSPCANYNCHSYAWYISEGPNNGLGWINPCQNSDSTGKNCNNPCDSCDKILYIMENYDIDLFKKGYMNINSRDTSETEYEFYMQYREKVKYLYPIHSAIIDKPDLTNPSNDTLISKWNDGRLIRHHPENCPFWTVNTELIYYQKQILRVDSGISANGSYCIAEKLLSNGTIASNNDNEFLVGFSDKSMIHLEPGFKAIRGCTLKAYTATPQSGGSYIIEDEPDNLEKIFSEQNENTNSYLSVYPNPTNGMATVSIHTKEKGIVLITIFDSIGNIVLNEQKNKDSKILEWKFNAQSLHSGTYYCKASIDGKEIGKTKFIVSR